MNWLRVLADRGEHPPRRPTLRRSAFAPIAAFVCAGLSVQCSNRDGSGPEGTADLSVAEIETFLQQNIALVRLGGSVLYVPAGKALAGENIAGVTVIDQGGGRFDVTASADADRNGSDETSLAATADVTTDGQGNLTRVVANVITFAGPGGIGANGQLTVEVIGGSGDPNTPILGVSSGGMQLQLPSGSVSIPDAGYIVDLTFPASPFVEGFIDFETGDVSATIFFESNGFGGWGTRVAGSKGGQSFEFTIP